MDKIFEQVIFLLEKWGPLPSQDREELREIRYLEEGHIDSFNLTQFILELEEQFNIVLLPTDTESERFRQIGGLVMLINDKLSELV